MFLRRSNHDLRLTLERFSSFSRLAHKIHMPGKKRAAATRPTCRRPTFLGEFTVDARSCAKIRSCGLHLVNSPKISAAGNEGNHTDESTGDERGQKTAGHTGFRRTGSRGGSRLCFRAHARGQNHADDDDGCQDCHTVRGHFPPELARTQIRTETQLHFTQQGSHNTHTTPESAEECKFARLSQRGGNSTQKVEECGGSEERDFEAPMEDGSRGRGRGQE